jgi:hypothetical protein
MTGDPAPPLSRRVTMPPCFDDEPGTRAVASLAMSTEDAWRLLTNNLPAGRQSGLAASGDGAITGILLLTRAIIGEPKWA